MFLNNKHIRHAVDVARWRLCVGCGACGSICPEGKIRLQNVVDEGIRPIWVQGKYAKGGINCIDCGICLAVCPGLQMTPYNDGVKGTAKAGNGIKKWGHVLELWEGYASDPEIRYKGSSGGLCTALSLFCLEEGRAGGVLHIGRDKDVPWKNRTYFSTDREELVARAGSRYAPASPCDRLGEIEAYSKPTVFIGKPCDVAALRMAQNQLPALLEKVALAVGFFCAGTPATIGTLDLLQKYSVKPSDLSAFRYRGFGWPGMATALFKDDHKTPLQLSYEDCWGFVQKYRPFRCYLCPDITAESADISVGDPWCRERGENEPGRSLILIRTERGREVFQEALAKGYINAEQTDPEIILRSQKNLLGKRQAIWGRLLAMKMFGIPTPNYEGYYLYENWLDLPLKEKVRSIAGTIRRIIQRKYYRPMDLWKGAEGAISYNLYD